MPTSILPNSNKHASRTESHELKRTQTTWKKRMKKHTPPSHVHMEPPPSSSTTPTTSSTSYGACIYVYAPTTPPLPANQCAHPQSAPSFDLSLYRLKRPPQRGERVSSLSPPRTSDPGTCKPVHRFRDCRRSRLHGRSGRDYRLLLFLYMHYRHCPLRAI